MGWCQALKGAYKEMNENSSHMVAQSPSLEWLEQYQTISSSSMSGVMVGVTLAVSLPRTCPNWIHSGFSAAGVAYISQESASESVILIYGDYESSVHSVLGIDVVKKAAWDTRDLLIRHHHQLRVSTQLLYWTLYTSTASPHAIFSSCKPQSDCICVIRTIESTPSTVHWPRRHRVRIRKVLPQTVVRSGSSCRYHHARWGDYLWLAFIVPTT